MARRRGVDPRLVRIDAYLRRESSIPARLLRLVARARGMDYATSGSKRRLDLAIAVPALANAALPLVILGALNRILHPSLPAFFTQDRVGHRHSVRVYKLRSMVPGATGPTPFGIFLRRHKLDELPQLAGVVSGELSLVGIRVLPYEVYGELQATWSPERFQHWEEAYMAMRPALTGIHQVRQGRAKRDRVRFHPDRFYARRAWLGLDLYLLWRTGLRVLDPPREPQ